MFYSESPPNLNQDISLPKFYSGIFLNWQRVKNYCSQELSGDHLVQITDFVA